MLALRNSMISRYQQKYQKIALMDFGKNPDVHAGPLLSSEFQTQNSLPE